MDLISIIITTHDRDRQLKRAIESVLMQTYNNIEIFVVDDNSKKSTQKVVAEFNSKINYIKSKKRGLASSRNIGLSASNGDFAVFLDDDDELEKDSVLKRKLYFDSLSDNIKVKTAVIYSGCNIEIIHEKRTAYHKPEIFGDVLDNLKLSKISTVPSTLFINKKVLAKFEVKFDESLSSFIDHDFFMSLAKNNLHMYFVNEPLTKTYSYPMKKSMVNDIEKRILNLNKFLKKWEDLLKSIFSKQNYMSFTTNYIAKEYSRLLLNCLITNDINGLKKLIFNVSAYSKHTRFLKFKIFKTLFFKYVRFITPSFLIKLIK